MTVWVDEISTYPESIMDAQTKRNGVRWTHLTADTVGELHDLAERIGMKREWFQNKGSVLHYDLTPRYREKALQGGAIFKPAREQARERIAARRQATNATSD